MSVREVDIKRAVRERYGAVARSGGAGCGPGGEGCCSPAISPVEMSGQIGYSEREMAEVPEGSNLGLGCGNPVALAALKEGDVVLDLGSGAGFDCFLAARRVGPGGRVIGVDMTEAMLEKARCNAATGGFANVEFRLGEIENLPVADASVDVIISNCVVNLSPDKRRVFREAFRVLRPGGRLMVSDLVLDRPLPESVRRSVEAYVGCIAGALPREEYLAAIREAGFAEVKVEAESAYPAEASSLDETGSERYAGEGLTPSDLKEAAGAVASVKVAARRP